jgi:hypothetical protein
LKAFFIFFTALLISGSCTSQKLGPPFPPLTGIDHKVKFPVRLLSEYDFIPGAPVYPDDMHGNLRIFKNRDKPWKALFEMKISGRLHNGSYRNKLYTGDAYFLDETLELRSLKCYEQGRKSQESRLSNLSGWTCDHLIFIFKDEEVSGKKTAESATLHYIPEHERTEFTRWLDIDTLDKIAQD